MFHSEPNKSLLFTILLENYPTQEHDHLREVFYYHFNDFQENEHLVESNKRFLDMIHQSMIFKNQFQNQRENQREKQFQQQQIQQHLQSEKKKLVIDATAVDVSFQELAFQGSSRNKIFFDDLFNLQTDFDTSMKTSIPEEINFKEKIDDALEAIEMQKLVNQTIVFRENQDILPLSSKKVSFVENDLKDKLQELKCLISEIEKLI